jgi:hypothetical protein
MQDSKGIVENCEAENGSAFSAVRALLVYLGIGGNDDIIDVEFRVCRIAKQARTSL